MPIYKWSKVAASNGNSDPTINYLEGMAPSAVNDSARAAMAAEAKFRDDISGTLTTTGSSTAYALTTNSVFDTAALMSGAMITFIPHATNGASPTLAVDGLTARAINQSTGVAVTAGQLVLGTPIVVTYIHATTEFILQGMVGATDPLQLLSTDAGAAVGPILDLYRDSASPAASDNLAAIDFNGRDSAGNKQLYARIKAQIVATTSTAESALWQFQQVIAGTLTTILSTTATAISSALILTLSNVTNALSLAGGTTGQRSGSPTAGDIRYNTSLNGLEYWNGTAWIVLGQQPTSQRLTTASGATYTATTTGVVRQRVRMVGAGGGGGAAATNAGSASASDTSFQVNGAGTAWTAVKGGGGGTSGGSPGIGGTSGTDGSTGALIARFSGAAGGSAFVSAAGSLPGGSGGSSPFGGAAPGIAAGAGQAAKANTGSGGGGGGISGGNGGAGGGAGEYVEFWVTGMATATYTIGAGGAGGTAGTQAGGAGGSGYIIVEEFYS